MKTLRFLALAACSLASASAGYVYDYPNLLNPYNATQWTSNGVITAGTGMVTSSDSNGGSLIFGPTVPGLSNSYEVSTTLAAPSSGAVYYTFLRASSDALEGGSGQGTWYYVQMAPTFSGTTCSATLNIRKRVSGTVTLLSTSTVPCGNGMVVRSIMTQTNYILVYINNVLYATVYDTSIATGQPGIGVHSAPSGCGITRVDIGHLDTVAPNAVTSIGASAFSDRVDLQWPMASDDTNGIGIAYYTVTRGGIEIAQTASTNFSDFTATAGNMYAYAVYAVDYHWNYAGTSTNITTPATIIDPRETGIRPTGS